MKKTAIVILNYNNVGDTINCVDSVLRYESPDSVKVVLVDNASKEEVYVEIRRYLQQKCNELLVLENGCQTNALPEELPFVTYLRNERNLGYGKGNNSALRILENDKTIGHVMILNNDTIFVQPIAANLAAYLDQHKQCGIVAPLLFERNMKTLDRECARREKNICSFLAMMPLLGHVSWIKKNAEKSYISLIPNEMKNPIMTQLISGACFVMRFDLFKELGYFDEGTFLYFEEDILWKKIQKEGLYACLLPTEKCIHLGANSTSKSSSLFIRKCHIDSMAHYLKNYSSFNSLWVGMILLSVRFSYYMRTKISK